MITFGIRRPSRSSCRIVFSSEPGSIVKVSGSISVNTGAAPSTEAAPAVAANVKSGTMMASPGPIPQAIIASIRASEPLAHVTQCFRPTYPASLSSSSSTSRPRINADLLSTLWMRVSISSRRTSYCVFRSLNNIPASPLAAAGMSQIETSPLTQ